MKLEMKPVHLFIFATSVMPIIGIVGSRGLAPLFMVTALGGFVLHFRQYGCLPRWPQGLFWPLALLIAYAGLTTLWSIDPMLSTKKAGGFVAYAFAFAAVISMGRDLSTGHRRLLGKVFVMSVVVGLAFLAFELLTESFFTRLAKGITPEMQADRVTARNLPALLNNGAALLALMVPIASAVLWARRRNALAGGLLLLALGVFSQCASASVLTAYCGGLAVLALATALSSHRVAQLLGMGFILVTLATPFIAAQIDWRDLKTYTGEGVMSSIPNPQMHVHRLIIYAFTAEKVFERPLLGWGLHSSRAIPRGTDVVIVRDLTAPPWQGKDGPIAPEMGGGNLLPLHPHNYALQWWLELGAVGVILGVGLIFRVLRRIITHLPTEPARRAALAQVGIWWIISTLSYGAWQHWWLSSVGLLAALTAALLSGEKDTP